jgi:hypothetical protein
MTTGEMIELPSIAHYDEAFQIANQMVNIPEDWTVTIIENKPTAIVVACAPPTYGLITVEKYQELQPRTASGLSVVPKQPANEKSVMIIVTYAHINAKRKTEYK